MPRKVPTPNVSKYTPECPCCDGTATKPISKGRSDSGNPVRSYRCLSCAERFCDDCASTAHRFATAEVVMPRGITMEHLDTALRDAKREWHRARHGYTGKATGQRRMADLDLFINISAYDRRIRTRRGLTSLSANAHMPAAQASLVTELAGWEPEPEPEREDYTLPHNARLRPGTKHGLHADKAACETCGKPIHLGFLGDWEHDDARGYHQRSA